MEQLEKITVICGAYDKRHANPSKNYGIHGMDMRFVLKGSRGAVQFVYYSCQHLKHVSDELAAHILRKGDIQYHSFQCMAADLGYHSKVPMYDGQSPMDDDCEYTDGPCYYDGSGLQATEIEDEFLAGGSAFIWKFLEGKYQEIFGDIPSPQPSNLERTNE